MPAKGLSLLEGRGAGIQQGVLFERLESCADGGQSLLDVTLAILRTEIRPAHAVLCGVHDAALSQVEVVGGQGSPDCATRVTGRGLDPEAGKIALPEHLAVGDAIEGDPTRQAQVALAGALRDG